MNTALDSLAASTAGAGAGPVVTQNDAASADRFLKLLVAQMQNQDPLNPMDNAQVTTQMAQINTVSGIDKLNTTVQGLNAQFVQMQALQGASLVGRDVTVPGNRFALADGRAQAGFELNGSADSVLVEVLSPAGQVVDTIDLGALGTGRHGFEWDAQGVSDPAGHTFRVGARLGTAEVPATPLMLDRVQAVSSGGDGLTLDLERSGRVVYTDVRAFN
jgi:flagellar basal-body rod modification protein FlgD